MISPNCLRLVALTIGAVTPGRAISQASDTLRRRGGVTRRDLVEALRMRRPRASR